MNVEGSIKFSIVEHTEDRVVSEMPIGAGIKNPYGGVHAGAILWFADVTGSEFRKQNRQVRRIQENTREFTIRCLLTK